MTTETRDMFGTLLRHHRLAAGLSQEALAERTGLSARAIRALESGQRRAPHPHTIGQLLRALRLPPADRARLEATLPRRLAPLPPDPAASNLPPALTSFVGREQELADIGQRLAAARLLTLTGTGGVGKTRLALAIAQAVAARPATEPDGVWLVELAALTDPSLVLPAVAGVLGVREQPGVPLLTTLLAALATRRLLLVLDNCEHLLDAGAALVDALLRASTGVRVLATSREALGVPGEVAWRVPSLGLPASIDSANGAALLRAEAVQLFVERAQAARPDVALTDETLPAVAEICRRLDGIPLAIELAAARLAALSVEDLASRLDDRFRLLTGGARTAPTRQQTLRATIDWSHDLLTAPERVVFRRLSVFAGGWSLAAAEAVGAGDDVASSDVLDLLARLVAKSLVQVDDLAGGARYRFLETVRQYAGEKLREAGEVGVVQTRHAMWCLALAERVEPELEGADQLRWLALLDAEHDNLRAALAWCLEHDPTTGLRLAGSIWPFWRVRGHNREGERWLDTLLASAPERTAARLKALLGIALLAESRSSTAIARTRLEESLALCRSVADRRLRALTLREAGFLVSGLGDHARGRALLEEGLALARVEGDDRGLGAALFMLARVAEPDGDHARARALGEESLQLLRRAGDRWMLGRALSFLGIVALRTGDCARAQALWEEALPIAQELGAPGMIAQIRVRLGWVALWQGDTERAAPHYDAALTLARRHALDPGQSTALSGLGRLAQVRGETARATALLTESLALATARDYQQGVGEATYGLGLVARDEGDWVQATSWLRQSLTVRQAMDDRAGIATCLEGLATIAAEQGQPGRTARLLGAADALRQAIGSPMPLVERPAYEAAIQVARAAMGQPAFEAAWAAGQALSRADAIAEALADHPSGASTVSTYPLTAAQVERRTST